MGAPRIHIVDLDGAAAGDVVNLEIIETIANAVQGRPSWWGNPLDRDDYPSAQDGGREVILGTVAVEKPELVREACRKYADFIIISIDARDGQVATRGWLQGTGLKAVDLAREMAGLGARRFIYTDIARDGTLSGPNYRATAELIESIKLPVIVAGGVSSTENLEELRRIGVEGAIIGRALYTGDIDLKKALEIANR
jgi:phosphoribosylformimino-5-aminoimidazole carboxamide ribotide isomerase